MKIALDRRDFEKVAYEGLSKYGSVNKRIEFLTLTINKIDERDIFKLFEDLNRSMLYAGKFGVIDFAGVVVDGQHIHTLIRKPFVKTDVLVKNWHDITKENSSILIKTVKGDKTKKKEMEKLVNYIINQGYKHDTDDTLFFQSQFWGVVTVSGKKKQKVSFTAKRFLRKIDDADLPMHYETRNYTEKELDDYYRKHGMGKYKQDIPSKESLPATDQFHDVGDDKLVETDKIG